MVKDSNKDLVTKSMLNDAVDTILKGIDNLLNKLNIHLDKMEDGLDGVETNITFIKRDVRDIKAELSDTPSRREFNSLKTRVDRYHPISKSV